MKSMFLGFRERLGFNVVGFRIFERIRDSNHKYGKGDMSFVCFIRTLRS